MLLLYVKLVKFLDIIISLFSSHICFKWAFLILFHFSCKFDSLNRVVDIKLWCREKEDDKRNILFVCYTSISSLKILEHFGVLSYNSSSK
uniref:Uncharacterized protein n=1 Tax=Rhizophora mucronata TaxID=61149 RepID=A0A2P2QCF6_RHIMU